MNKTQQTPKHRREEAVSLTISRLIVCGGGQKQKKEGNTMEKQVNKISLKDRELIEELCLKRFGLTKENDFSKYIEEWIYRYNRDGSDFVSYMDKKTLAIWKDIYNNFLTKKGAK